MRARMKKDLVIDALRMAWFRRHPAPGLIFHSDRGSQLLRHELQAALTAYGVRSSMSRKGDGWDNAPTESLWGSLKVARVHGVCFATRRAAMDEAIDWMGFYNHRRLHSTLAYVSPIQLSSCKLRLSKNLLCRESTYHRPSPRNSRSFRCSGSSLYR
jgi:putative transposase